MLAAIAIPNFAKARISAQRAACISNLRIIDGAKQNWALEARQRSDAVPTKSDLAPYVGRGGSSIDAVVCPAGGGSATFDTSYSINAVSNAPTCLIEPATHVIQ
jgi:hypothetical protein